jgi:hypothetical protein
MTWLDRHDLRSPVFRDTTVGVFDVDPALGQEAGVRVHAQLSPGNLFHVDRPAKPDGVHHALDARRAGTSNFEPDAPDVAAFGALHGGKWTWRRRSTPNSLALFDHHGRSDVLSHRVLFRHVSSP